jgi:hypothetical protein
VIATVPEGVRPAGVPNRATRRAMGLRQRFEDRMANAVGPIAIPPRYVRRNFKDGILTKPRNRRQRKVRARILRSMA